MWKDTFAGHPQSQLHGKSAGEKGKAYRAFSGSDIYFCGLGEPCGGSFNFRLEQTIAGKSCIWEKFSKGLYSLGIHGVSINETSIVIIIIATIIITERNGLYNN